MSAEHDLSFRHEQRYSEGHAHRDWSDRSTAGRLKCYPCLTTCNEKSHTHDGMSTFIYAECSCGWSALAGESDAAPILEGRLLHLQHQINDMRGL
jgi:hypothetical protein